MKIVQHLRLVVASDRMTQFSSQFLQGMINRMIVGEAKYGTLSKDRIDKVDCLKSLQQRLDKYEETGNTEWLMDAANFAMMEFMFPKHSNAHYRPTDSKESPGYTDNDAAVRKL